MGFGKEFIVKEIGFGKFEVQLVERVTGRLIEKHGMFDDEDQAENQAEYLNTMGDQRGQDGSW